MPKFTRIPEKTFDEIQLNAGILLKDFKPETGTMKMTDLIGATSGGVNVVATPEYTDFGEDIDNAPTNVKELKKLTAWSVTMSGNFVTVSAEMAKMLIGAADMEGEHKIIPRSDILDTDFTDLWWVGDYGKDNSEENGGFLAVHMLNSLSTGGFNIQSANKGKGQLSFEFTGHYSIKDQTKVPFEVYVYDTTAAE